MVKKIIYQQFEERNDLLNREYIERVDISDSSGYLSTGLIKLITGPRRAGKSVLSLLLLKNKNFAYLNFDDDMLLKHFDEDAVIQSLNEVYPDYKYLLLDEIQNLQNWELWVNKMHRRGVNIIITGSNAKLLSYEMATSLTGRFIQIELYPFSFAEVLRFHNVTFQAKSLITPRETGNILNLLSNYLMNGGFPEILLNPASARNYLSALFDSVLLKDIVKRFRIRKSQQLYDLSNYLLANYTNPFSFNELKIALNFNSVPTIQKFTGYLSETYLFISLTKYSVKIKTHQKSPRKFYIIDNGFIKSRSFEISPSYGRLLENVVFTELLRRHFRPELDLFFYRTRNDREIDFLCRNGHITEQLIQVCYDISNLKTLNREITALAEASDELSCHSLLLITWDREDEIEKKGCIIKLIPAWKWLTVKGEKTLNH
jgi:hypothetical protein